MNHCEICGELYSIHELNEAGICESCESEMDLEITSGYEEYDYDEYHGDGVYD